MNKGEVDRAVRNALNRFDEWYEVTEGIVNGYRSEVESCIEDAVHIGIRAALALPYVGVENDDLNKGFNAPE